MSVAKAVRLGRRLLYSRETHGQFQGDLSHPDVEGHQGYDAWVVSFCTGTRKRAFLLPCFRARGLKFYCLFSGRR